MPRRDPVAKLALYMQSIKAFALRNGRAWLWCAWVCTALLTVPHAPSLIDAVADVVVAAGLAGVISFLPAPWWKVTCVATLIALPYTLWWCGVAAAGGAGAEYDAAVAAVETNPNEALGALKYVFGLPAFVMVGATHLVFVCLACAAALQPPRSIAAQGSERRFVQLAWLACMAPLSLCALFYVYSIGSALRTQGLFGPATTASPLGSAGELIADGIEWAAAHNVVRDTHARPGASKKAANPVYSKTSAQASKIVTAPVLAIFIVGESVRADGYGPGRRNRGAASRRLAERIDAGLGAWLPTTCASSDGTHLSVPMLLTATPPDHEPEAASAPTILGILKAAGFKTAWLSNNEAGPQGRERGHDLYAGVANVNPDAPAGTPLQHWKFDADMVPTAKEFAGSVQGPTALIMHAVGSHIPYEWRYPEGFFGPEPAHLGSDQLVELRYANSLEYEMRMILDVAAILDATNAPAFLIYVSDHGENLPSDHNGLLTHLGPRTSIIAGTVPAFVLWNKAMADSGKPAQVLSHLLAAKLIAHADVARLFLILAGEEEGPLEPTAQPKTWGRVSVGDRYAAVPCSELMP
jgi:glucan phosphoethanolaminetransferase (alkaline phosphatase superfamily)